MSLVRGDGTFITDDDITKCATILVTYNKENGSKFYINNFPPCVQQLYGSGIDPPADHKYLPEDKPTINFILTNNHWLTVVFHPDNETSVSIYDSLATPERKSDVMPILQKMYRNISIDKVNYMPVTQQGEDPVCGAFAVAVAICVLRGKKPETLEFDKEKMRMHFNDVLEKGKPIFFPTTGLRCINCRPWEPVCRQHQFEVAFKITSGSVKGDATFKHNITFAACSLIRSEKGGRIRIKNLDYVEKDEFQGTDEFKKQIEPGFQELSFQTNRQFAEVFTMEWESKTFEYFLIDVKGYNEICYFDTKLFEACYSKVEKTKKQQIISNLHRNPIYGYSPNPKLSGKDFILESYLDDEESINIQYKFYRPEKKTDHELLKKLHDQEGLRKYMSAFTQLTTGGNIFIGLEEIRKKDRNKAETKTDGKKDGNKAETKTNEMKGTVYSVKGQELENLEDIDKGIDDIICQKMCWVTIKGEVLEEADIKKFFKKKFHSVQGKDRRYVIEIAAAYFHGFVFTDKDGPVVPYVSQDGSVKRQTIQEWHNDFFNKETWQASYSRMAYDIAEIKTVVKDRPVQDLEKHHLNKFQSRPEWLKTASEAYRELEDLQTCVTEAELNRLAAHLKEGYAENDKFYIPLLPGCFKIPVGEICAPVILTKNDAGKEQSLSSYKAMLCQEVPKKQLFLVGEAGAGKTTFCKHLIDVWRSESTTSQFDNPDVLRSFKFVFHVFCRFANEEDSVLDMICDQLPFNESMKKIAIHVLSHSPEACFIIIDGLDEWQGHPGKSTGLLGDTTGLPGRKGVEDCLILITSRPWRLQALGREIEPKARFELAGLKSPEQLIEKILSRMEYPDPAILCNKFLREVRTCGMAEMIKIPLILIIVLSIWEQSSDSEQNKSLHPSLCRNYMNMIESLILRADDKHHWTGDERRLMEPLVNNPEYWKTKWEEKSVSLPSCCQELESFKTFSGLIISLSHLAFNLLFGESTSDEQKLVFSKLDCKKYLSDEELNVCLGIGILAKSQTSRGMKKMESYSFPHKTFQEFLSALWLAGPGADSAGRITERISKVTDGYSLYHAVNNVEMLLKFLSGLGPQVAAEPLQYIYTQGIKYYGITSRINQFILSCCAESQHCNNTKHIYFTFPEIVLLGGVLYEETMSDDDLRMLANIVEASSSCLRRLDIWNLTLEHESVEEPSDISSCHSSIDTLYQSLSCCGNLEDLRLENISCSDYRHDNISRVLDLHNLHKLEMLTLRELSVRTVLWPQVTNSCLRVLEIWDLKLTHECVKELCRTYEQYRQLEREDCEVGIIFCVDHRTDCDSFEDLQKHIMLVNLPYFDDDDNGDVDSDDFDSSDSVYCSLSSSDYDDDNDNNNDPNGDNVDSSSDSDIYYDCYDYFYYKTNDNAGDNNNYDLNNAEDDHQTHDNEDSCCSTLYTSL